MRAASTATYAAFIALGFAFASWASRIPQVQAALELSPQALGLVLLSLAAGSTLALPLAGVVVHRLGARRTVQLMAMINSASLVMMAVGHQFGVVPLVIGLFGFGFGQGGWDVAMNVQGADVERGLGRSIMARYHAGFSVGTVAGALLGALAVAVEVPVAIHLTLVAVALGTGVPLAVRRFLDPVGDQPGEGGAAGGARRHPLAAWLEPRTLVVGLFVLTFAFTEGAANDWVAVALIRDFDAPPAVGTLGFATFLSAMTLSRWVGPRLLDRYGRVPVIRVTAVLSLAGVSLFVFTDAIPLALVGTAMWGLGAALGFPVGMSAGSDEPRYAAARVSVIASIGYASFLGGPPLIGFLGEHVTVQKGLLCVAVLMTVALLIAGAVRPPRPDPAQLR